MSEQPATSLSPRALALRIGIMAALGLWVWSSLDRPMDVDFLGDPGQLAVPDTPPSGPPERFVDRAAEVAAAGCPLAGESVLYLELGAKGLVSAVLHPPPDTAGRACLEAALAAGPWPATEATLEIPIPAR